MNDIQIYNKNKLIPSLLSSIFSHAVPGPNWSAISSQNMQNLLDIFVYKPSICRHLAMYFMVVYPRLFYLRYMGT